VVNDRRKHATDQPTIRLILCQEHDRLLAEYRFAGIWDIAKPIGVAEWQTRLVQSLPEPLKGSLPSIEEIEAELGKKGPCVPGGSGYREA
jgi:hypothetical protein